MVNSIIVGVDIAKAKFDAALPGALGKGLKGQTFENNPQGFAQFRAWVGGPARVGIEATGPYWMSLAEDLHRAGWTVFLLNPAFVKAHGDSAGRRHKTDRADAALIADYVRTHNCEPWQPLPAELAELRELMRLYADVTEAAAALGQRQEGLRTPGARALQHEVAGALKEFARKILKAASQHARAHESLSQPVERLKTIKGVGEVTALILAAELPRQKSARSVANWAGVIPRHFESGESVRKSPKISKKGSDYVRSILYWPAITALRCNPAMQAFAERLKASGHTKMQIVGAAMHKLLRWAVGVVKSNTEFNALLHTPS